MDSIIYTTDADYQFKYLIMKYDFISSFIYIYTKIPIIWMYEVTDDDMSILVASIASGDRCDKSTQTLWFIN